MYEAKQANGDQIDGNDIIQQAGHEEDKNPRNQGNGRAQHDNVQIWHVYPLDLGAWRQISDS